MPKPQNTPPCDPENEQMLLAALLTHPKLYKQVDVSIEDFYVGKHQKIYQCICELAEDGTEEVSIFSVHARLKDKGFGNEVTLGYLAGLGDLGPGVLSHQFKSYLSVVKKKSAARKLLNLSHKLAKISQNGLNNLTGKIEESIRELAEIKQKSEIKPRGLTEEVRDWVLITSGNFLITDVYKDLGVITRDNKMKVATALNRLEKENIIVKCGEKRGCYRLLEKDAPLIDFLNVNLSDPYPIKWPFGLEDYVDLYPGNVVVVAGAANAGKTALLLNLVKMNMYSHKIEYFSSEMGPEELHLRLKKFEDVNMRNWNFAARKRSTKFADVVVPDSLNIIDYLEITKDFYEIGGDIKDIFDRLNRGIAIIALQKKKGSDTGRGGEFTLEKPRLYLTMDDGVLKIVKGKNWANPQINPNNMTWKFKLVNGCKFIETGGSVWNLT